MKHLIANSKFKTYELLFTIQYQVLIKTIILTYFPNKTRVVQLWCLTVSTWPLSEHIGQFQPSLNTVKGLLQLHFSIFNNQHLDSNNTYTSVTLTRAMQQWELNHYHFCSSPANQTSHTDQWVMKKHSQSSSCPRGILRNTEEI